MVADVKGAILSPTWGEDGACCVDSCAVYSSSAASEARSICSFDLFVRALLVAVNGLGVEAKQHRDAVACPPSDLGRGNAGLKPERDARVAQGVRHISQRRGCLGLSWRDGQ